MDDAPQLVNAALLHHGRSSFAHAAPQPRTADVSLITRAAREQERQQSLAQRGAIVPALAAASANGGASSQRSLGHVLVTVDSTLANACDTGDGKSDPKSGVDAQIAHERATFNVKLPSRICNLLGHRLVYGQIRSWEIALLQCLQNNPARLEALLIASPNLQPIAGQDRYALGVTELYNITPQRKTVRFTVAGSRCPSIDLPLTLVDVERVVAFHAAVSPCLPPSLGDSQQFPATPLFYAFRTRKPHHYVPGLTFFAVTCNGENPVLANGTRLVVIESGALGDYQQCDCFEFIAAVCDCDQGGCCSRQARVFDPFNDSIIDQRYCVDIDNQVLFALRNGCAFASHEDDANAIVSSSDDEQSETDAQHCQSEDKCNIVGCVESGKHQSIFAYVPPPTSPQQLTFLVNGTLSALACYGYDIFDRLRIQVSYDASIDQYAIEGAPSVQQPIGCIYQRSLFDDECCAVNSLNFPLSRKVMVATECVLEAKERYLNDLVNSVYYFTVKTGVNDSFSVHLECGDGDGKKAITVPSGCYTARLFVEALQDALNQAFVGDAEFRVDYRLFATEQLVSAGNAYRQLLKSAKPHVSTSAVEQALQSALLRNATPYTNVSFAIFISTTKTCGDGEHGPLFSLHLNQDAVARRFARLIDFDADGVYELQNLYASQSVVNAVGCVSRGHLLRWIGKLTSVQCCDGGEEVCAPCPRRRYEVQVERACGIVTLRQRIQRPFLVRRDDAKRCVSIVSVDDGKDTCAPLLCIGDVVLLSKENPLCTLYEKCNDDLLAVVESQQDIDSFCLSCVPEDCQEFWVWSSPVGFNVHLHRDNVANQCSTNYGDSEQIVQRPAAAQRNAVTRYLGFDKPTTLTGAFCYRSDHSPASIIDESILVDVSTLKSLAQSEARNSLYAAISPFDQCTTEYYAQLLLDRATGLYRTFPALTMPLPQPSAPADVLPARGASSLDPPNHLSVDLRRPDGCVYFRYGNDFTLTFQFIFSGC